jgi:predicted RNase H-like HicB family nuclease
LWSACESSQTLEESQLPIRRGGDMIVKVAMKKLKFVVEKHRDGYVAYPLGLKGAVVGQGESYESALADAKSAAAFHIESFGKEAFDDQDDVMEAFVTEASLTAG